MLGRLRPDSLLLKHTEKVFRLEESHSEQPGLGLDLLFKEHVEEELLRCLVLLQEMHHEHDHDFN